MLFKIFLYSLCLYIALWFPLAQGQNLPYLDGDFGCFEKSIADKYVKDFKINVASFGGPELCNTHVDFKKLINDLSIIKNGRFQSPSSHALIGGIVDQSQYYQWASQQIQGIVRSMIDPQASALNRGGFFTIQDMWAKLSTLFLLDRLQRAQNHLEGRADSAEVQDNRQLEKILEN